MFKTVLVIWILVIRICFVFRASDFVILLLASKEALLFVLSLFYPLLVDVCEAFDYVGIGLGEVFGFGGILSYIA